MFNLRFSSVVLFGFDHFPLGFSEIQNPSQRQHSSSSAAEHDLPKINKSKSIRLSFDHNGMFQLLQFTDLHTAENRVLDTAHTYVLMKKLLDKHFPIPTDEESSSHDSNRAILVTGDSVSGNF